MKKILCMILAGALSLSLLAGCGSSSTSSSTPTPAASGSESADTEPTGEPAGEKIKVAMIASSSGMGDRSFNDAAWEGFKNAEAELGVEIKVIEPASAADYQTAASSLASGGYKMIMAVGNDWGDTISAVAPKFPDVDFVGLNFNATGDNVAIAQTSDHEGGFVVGALAAMMSKSGVVGFIGGKDVPSINRFDVGYQEGAKYVNPDIQVISTYVGAFNDPVKGKEFAIQLISQKADIIFHAAGQSGEGLFEAIKENDGVYAIGCDSNQDYIVEGKVLTTAEKRLQTIAYDMIKSVQEGTFTPGIKVYGLKEGGVGITELQYTKDVIGAENIQKLEEIEQKIISGEIKVTDIFAK